MKYFFICVFLLLCTFPTFSKSVNIIEDSEVIFNPFKCNELQTEYLRVNDDSNCVIIQKLSNAFEIKSNDFDKNTWQSPQIIKYLDNKDGGKIIAHSWNNVVQWGEKSNKQPFSHLVVLDINDLNSLFSSTSEIKSNHLTLPLSLRRVEALDTDSDGNEEIIYLSNREDGRNRNSSWKDVNYIFDLTSKTLRKFGSSQFSHDLMYLDFDKDGYVEILDYYYGDKKPPAIDVCELKTDKCEVDKNAGKFVDIGFNHLFASKYSSIIFGGCPNLGNTTFCWAEVEYKKRKLKFKKLSNYEFKKKPKDKADFLIWTGDVEDKPGYWVKGSDRKQFKMADRSWISASIDFNIDGFTDSIAIEKNVFCTREDSKTPFNRSGGDCKDEAFMYIFKNNNDEYFEKHQIIPTTINDSFRIEKADVNKDGTIDLYGFVQGYPNPWMNCKREQLKSVYLNQNGEYFEKTSKKFINDSFGMYGCERASNFFEKDGNYYRLFITMPSAESEEAYLGIERY
ncbi:hypothetical protein N9354_00415 [Alphaproteobacteria bacterium]|nr:hypothetical protein [Alphaproteobacteria bacterium]